MICPMGIYTSSMLVVRCRLTGMQPNRTKNARISGSMHLDIMSSRWNSNCSGRPKTHMMHSNIGANQFTPGSVFIGQKIQKVGGEPEHKINASRGGETLTTRQYPASGYRAGTLWSHTPIASLCQPSWSREVSSSTPSLP